MKQGELEKTYKGKPKTLKKSCRYHVLNTEKGLD